VLDGKLWVDLVIRSAAYEAAFFPSSFFDIDADVEPLLISSGGRYGLLALTSGMPVFQVDRQLVRGVAAFVSNTGLAYLAALISPDEWYISNTSISGSAVTSIGLAFRSDAVTLRLNGRETLLKFSGAFSEAPRAIDSVRLIAEGLGTIVRFDNVCAGALNMQLKDQLYEK
jgi:hypothetical protein